MAPELSKCHATTFNSVINTTELLECVLLNLDLQTLLTSAQRVSRSWRDLIQNSPSLQQTLFFLPIETKNDVSSGDCEYQLNPLLKSLFPTLFNNEKSSDPDTDLPWAKDKLDLFLRSEASWRRMFVCQPPVYKLGIFEIGGSMMGCWNRIQVRTQPGGTRMAELFDMCLGNMLSFYVYLPSQRMDSRPLRAATQELERCAERASKETDIFVFLNYSVSSCCEEDDPQPSQVQQQISEFVHKFKAEVVDDKDDWVREEITMWE